MSSSDSGSALRVTAVAASAQLGGTERMLLDFANRAFESGIALKVVTPLHGPLVRILKNIGVPTEVVPAPAMMLRGSQQVGYLWSLPTAVTGVWKWSRALVRHEFVAEAQVLYSVAFKPHLALALARRRPVVWHLHEFPPQRTGRIWRALARRVPDGLIANSECVGRAWSSTGSDGPASSIDAGLTIVPNGINLDRFKPALRTFWIHDQLGLPHHHRLIGMPAVFARWKGQLEVIAAFEQIASQYPDVHLVIIGGSIYDTLAERQYAKEIEVEVDRAATGEWATVTDSGRGPAIGAEMEGAPETPGAREDAERISQASLLAPRVHLLPFLPKIEGAYPEFDLAVHYSLRPEPFGRVIVEAMASGIPVIAAREGGPMEILGGGIDARREAGWLVEPRNPAALARTLETALDLPTVVMRSIGEAGRRRAEDLYSWRRYATDVAKALRRGAAARVA